MRISRLRLATVIAIASTALGAFFYFRYQPPEEKSSELIFEVVRLAASKASTPADIRPYDESLSWHEYKVKRVLQGKLRGHYVRIAHWTVVDGKAVPVSDKIGEVAQFKVLPIDRVMGIREVHARNDLTIDADEPPRFLDVARPLPAKLESIRQRFDYFGIYSQQMMLYWQLRAQLKLVAMGNSHAGMGIATGMFDVETNAKTPLALNLAAPGCGMDMQCLMVDEYLRPLPKLEWVLWVASPGLFNARHGASRNDGRFMGSTGRQYDVTHKDTLWPLLSAPLVTVEALQHLPVYKVDVWGWEGRDEGNLPADVEALRKSLYKHMEDPDFAVSENQWTTFTTVLRGLNARHVRVLLLTAPMHPLYKTAPVADPNGTTHEGTAEIVRRLSALHATLPFTWFRDFNQDAAHDFPETDFYDGAHLNAHGATRLTQRISVWMKDCEKEKG